MGDLAVEVRGLQKRYGDLEAVRGIDLEIRRGEVFALLGPNGAGKTTTVEILEGHRARSGGEVSVLGHDPARREKALLQRIGIVLQTTGVEPYLSVEETIELFRGYYPDPLPLDDVLELVGLQEKRSSRVRKLSGGLQRRLDVGVGICGNPELLFLDEPTTGFDPAARRGAWGMIRGLRELGKTIVLTTHYLDEAQALADRVAIIAQGKILVEGAPDSLAGRETTTISFRRPDGELPGVAREAEESGGVLTLRTDRPTAVLHELTHWAADRHIELDGLQVMRASLEDVYLQLTGGEDA